MIKKYYLFIALTITAFQSNAMNQKANIMCLTPGQQSFCHECKNWVGGQDEQFHTCYANQNNTPSQSGTTSTPKTKRNPPRITKERAKREARKAKK